MSQSTSDNEPQKSSWTPAEKSPVPNPAAPPPGSAPSAPYPAGAPSAPYPASSPSADLPPTGAYPGQPGPAAPGYPSAPAGYPAASAGSASYPQGGYSNQPPGYGNAPGYSNAPGYGNAPGVGGAPGYGSAPGYGAPAGTPPRPVPAGPKTGIAALFDFSFSDYATPSIVKTVYVLTFVVNVLGWLAATWFMFSVGSMGAYYGSGVSGAGVLTLLVGWVPALLNIATMRLALEFYLITLRTNGAVTEIKAALAARSDD